MKKSIIMTAFILSVLVFTGCGKTNTETVQNIEEIYREQGIPVKVRSLAKGDFTTYLSFTSSLKGSKESIASSLISDTVEEILVETGDFVEKDQPVIRFPRNNPAVNYYQAEAAYKAAEQGFRRIETLYENNGISRQSYDDTKTQYDVQLANWKTVNDMIEVKSPISGYITRVNVQPTDNVHPGDSLFTVSNFDSLTSIVWVADHEIRRISKGQKATATWEDSSLSGIVTQVDLAMDAGMKAFAVHILFANSDHAVPSGITATIDIETSLTEDTIVLHRNEILRNQNEWYVYVAQDGLAIRQTIETGKNQGMYYEILSGLKEEESLITEGLGTLRNNSPIQVHEEPVQLLSKN